MRSMYLHPTEQHTESWHVVVGVVDGDGYANVRVIVCRLRQTDVKAGHYERKVQALEAARDQWETKYEEMAKKYADTKKELDDFVAEIGNI